MPEIKSRRKSVRGEESRYFYPRFYPLQPIIDARLRAFQVSRCHDGRIHGEISIFESGSGERAARFFRSLARVSRRRSHAIERARTHARSINHRLASQIS
jgi:hypothetical protein